MLDDLISFLDALHDWESPRLYCIAECFGDKPPCEYMLYNLTLIHDCNGEIITGKDMCNRLREDLGYVLSQFLAESVIDIEFADFEDMITISFTDGYIIIYY